jgi:hypothetical protein
MKGPGLAHVQKLSQKENGIWKLGLKKIIDKHE